MDRASILRRPGYVVDPQAPFGRDPATGVPLSDKSAVTAGLLQLFFGVFGIGRFYIGTTQIAALQLCLGLVGILFGLFCLVGLPVLLGVAVWAVIDAIMMFTGSVKDNFGRKLR
jgi:TM2 domain-containing membrane protein YozV